MELTPFVYDKKIKFEFGNALVSCGGKLGYFNSEGKEIIPYIYEILNRIHHSLCGQNVMENMVL